MNNDRKIWRFLAGHINNCCNLEWWAGKKPVRKKSFCKPVRHFFLQNRGMKMISKPKRLEFESGLKQQSGISILLPQLCKHPDADTWSLCALRMQRRRPPFFPLGVAHWLTDSLRQVAHCKSTYTTRKCIYAASVPPQVTLRSSISPADAEHPSSLYTCVSAAVA